jgi:lipopolysaccharide export system protein LptA
MTSTPMRLIANETRLTPRAAATLLLLILCWGWFPHPGAAEETGATVITSQRLELHSGTETHRFIFSGEVQVEGDNLRIECQSLTVLTRGGANVPAGLAADPGQIERIVAEGDVVIHMDQRRAEAGRATFFPDERRVVLEDKPRLIDPQGTVTGHRVILLEGERRVIVEGREGEPSRVVLPGLGRVERPDDNGEASDE